VASKICPSCNAENNISFNRCWKCKCDFNASQNVFPQAQRSEAINKRSKFNRNFPILVASIVIALLAAIFITIVAVNYFTHKPGPPRRDSVVQQQPRSNTASSVESNTSAGQSLPQSDTNIIFEVTSDKTTAAINEKIKLDYNLYTRYDTRYEGFESEGRFRGFWIEQATTPQPATRGIVVLNGKRYVKATIRETILSPIYSGDLVIDPGIIKVSIRGEDQQKNADKRTMLLNSKPITIHVDNPTGKSKATFLAEFTDQHRMGIPASNIKTDKPALIILLDISGSMIAEDMQPQNRLTSAKTAISNFLRANTEMLIGLKCFSKDVMTISPLTQSKSEVIEALDGIQHGLSKEDGTSIGDAVFEATKELAEYVGNKKTIILLTDGVNNSGHLDPLTAIDLASNNKIFIHAIALGTKGLVPFPVNDPKLGNRKVMANVGTDEKTLAEMAKETGGRYGTATSEAELEGLLSEVRKTLS